MYSRPCRSRTVEPDPRTIISGPVRLVLAQHRERVEDVLAVGVEDRCSHCGHLRVLRTFAYSGRRVHRRRAVGTESAQVGGCGALVVSNVCSRRWMGRLMRRSSVVVRRVGVSWCRCARSRRGSPSGSRSSCATPMTMRTGRRRAARRARSGSRRSPAAITARRCGSRRRVTRFAACRRSTTR